MMNDEVKIVYNIVIKYEIEVVEDKKTVYQIDKFHMKFVYLIKQYKNSNDYNKSII